MFSNTLLLYKIPKDGKGSGGGGGGGGGAAVSLDWLLVCTNSA